MDVTGLTSLSTALAQAQTGDAVGTLVLKKAMQIEAQGALQLIEAATQGTRNPQHLGNQVDVQA